MKTEKTCCFFGHAVLPTNMEKAILENIYDVIENAGIDTFLVGGYGEFDEQSENMVLKAKEKYPHIKLYLIKPKQTKEMFENVEKYAKYDQVIVPAESNKAYYKATIEVRNRWVVDHSSTVITYLHTDYGGAYKAVKYAEKHGKRIIYVHKRKKLHSFRTDMTREEFVADFERRAKLANERYPDSIFNDSDTGLRMRLNDMLDINLPIAEDEENDNS